MSAPSHRMRIVFWPLTQSFRFLNELCNSTKRIGRFPGYLRSNGMALPGCQAAKLVPDYQLLLSPGYALNDALVMIIHRSFPNNRLVVERTRGCARWANFDLRNPKFVFSFKPILCSVHFSLHVNPNTFAY